MKATLIRSHVFLYGGEHIKPGEKNFRPELFKLEDGKSQFINMTPYYPLMYHAAIPTMNCGESFRLLCRPEVELFTGSKHRQDLYLKRRV